jgi:hypothetical protein
MAATAPGGWEDIKRESSEGDEDSGSELGLHSGLSKSELR